MGYYINNIGCVKYGQNPLVLRTTFPLKKGTIFLCSPIEGEAVPAGKQEGNNNFCTPL
jgi:hypothetical protein